MVPSTCLPTKYSSEQREDGHGVVHQKLLSIKEESHKKTQRTRKVQNGPFLGGHQEEGHGVVHHVQ